jgi:ATP-dependent Clp protease ATP-binding subunit ClpX
MTTYSETGYVGQDVISILTRLLYAADLNIELASIGVVCMDEFDKLATCQNNAVFAGAGTTKDVSGLGVQRELLKMLETTDITIPLEMSQSSFGPRAIISTRDIPFIACGAFSGLKGMIDYKGEHIGFGREALPGDQDKIAVNLSVDEVEMVKNFINFGFLPELIGRFKRIVPFKALSEVELEAILNRNILVQYKNELLLDGIQLEISPALIKDIIKQSIKKETGARGIEATLMRYMEDGVFEAYSSPGIKRLSITLKDGQVTYKLD